MFRNLFLLLAFLTFSHAHATNCPHLTGVYLCGFEGSVEFPIEIQQGETEGVTVYEVFDTQFRADGVERVIPEGFDEDFAGHYSSTCGTDSLEISVHGVFSTLGEIVHFPLFAKMTLAPEMRDGISLVKGNLFVELKGKYPSATKEFLTGTLDLKLSDEETFFSCRSVNPGELF